MKKIQGIFDIRMIEKVYTVFIIKEYFWNERNIRAEVHKFRLFPACAEIIG